MNKIIYILIFLTVSSCNNGQKINTKTTNLDSSTISKPVNKIARTSVQYSDQQLETFLDSVGQLSTQPLVNTVAFFADSVFKNQLQLNSIISLKDFNTLKRAARKGVIAVNTARRIFQNNNIDSNCNEKDILLTYKKGFIPVVYFPFDKNKSDYNEYALCIGDPEHCPNAYLYFFKANRIIGRHDAYNRYGLELKHYKDIDGKTVVYYICEFNEGTGEWWNNFFFYKYDSNKLIPVLNELQNGNMQNPGSRSLWLESFVQKTNPLTIKMVYDDEFPDFTKDIEDYGPKIIDDSTSVQYVWNEQSKTLKGQYEKSKISKAQILSYYSGKNDLLFINSYYKTLKSSLIDTTKRKSTLNYLNEVKNYYNNNLAIVPISQTTSANSKN